MAAETKCVSRAVCKSLLRCAETVGAETESSAKLTAKSCTPSMALIECVPNFSEGRDQSVIDAIYRSSEAGCEVEVEA